MMMKFFPPTQIDQILEKGATINSMIDLKPLMDQITTNADSINVFDFDQLETRKIFHLSQIKKVCIDYRLRFLDIKYFKGNLPKEAIEKITQLEKDHQTTLDGFKIMATSVLFTFK